MTKDAGRGVRVDQAIDQGRDGLAESVRRHPVEAGVCSNRAPAPLDIADLMPGAVGAGTFWKGMTDYVSGSVELDQAMEEIQKGWEGIKK